MRISDQPTCFGSVVGAAVSAREDGTMLDRTRDNRHDLEIVANRKKFCQQAGIRYEDCVYQIISYEPGTPFDTIQEINEPNTEGVFADVLYTEQPGVGMFLPVADCVAVVIYDQKRKALALAHIGRHASIAKTISKTIGFFKQKGSDSGDLLVWMGPSVSKHDYILTYFDHLTDSDWKNYAQQQNDGTHLDLTGFNKALMIQNGVLEANIFISSVNTATDPNYFSHSQGDVNGRFAVVAQLR